MPLLLWDASALAKRYAPEVGTDTVDALFLNVPFANMATTVLGYAETFSLLLRKRNSGVISEATFLTATAALQNEFITNLDVALLSLDDNAILGGIPLMQQHNLNASDAAILAAFLRYVQHLPAGGPTAVVVASDRRLVRAAQAEGLHALNPELTPAADVPAFIASL